MQTQDNLSVALEDVRDAYRLIWGYQRRCLDTVRLLSENFGDRTFYQWSNYLARQPPLRGSSPFEKWSLEFMPLYCASFLFLREGAYSPRSGDWMLEIKLTTDTQTDPFIGTGNQPDLESFAPSKESRSEISLIAWKCLQDQQENSNWLRQVWELADWPEADASEPFVALDYFHAYRLDEGLDRLATRQDIETFAEKAKKAFKEKLNI